MYAGHLIKRFRIVLILTCVAGWWSLLTGCQKQDTASGSITFLQWGDDSEGQKIFQNLVRKFQKLNPGIKVVVETVPNTSYQDVLLTRFASGNGPDVFYVPDGSFAAVVNKNVLLPLDSFIAASTEVVPREMWQSGLWRYRTDGLVRGTGHIYALPKDIGPTVMYYNRDLFEKAGVTPPPADRPITWSQAVSMWKRFLNPQLGRHFGAIYFPLESALWSHGGEYFNDDLKFIMNKGTAATEAMQWLVDLTYRYKVHPPQDVQSSLGGLNIYESGMAACSFNGRWMVPRFRNLTFNWDVAEIPVSDATLKPAGWSGSVGIGICRSIKHRAAAWKLVEFLAGTTGQKAQATTGMQIPNQMALAETDLFLQPGKAPLNSRAFVRAARYERPLAVATYMISDRWLKTFNEEAYFIWQNKVTVKEGLERIAARVQPIVDEEKTERTPLTEKEWPPGTGWL